jgi:hypothetical protein
MTPKQRDILGAVAAWADEYPCIQAIHVFGSIARDEAGKESDLGIAFEYVPGIRGDDHEAVECYTKVNGDWESFAERMRMILGICLGQRDCPRLVAHMTGRRGMLFVLAMRLVVAVRPL